MLDLVYEYVGTFMYPGVIVLLVACGMGLPIPEDAILLAAGAAVAASGGSLYGMIGAAMVGVMAGDLITFSIGRRFGQSIASTRAFAWMFTEARVRRIRAYFRKYGDRTIFLARFVAGLRALTFLMAGSMGVPLRRFVGINLVAAVITVPLEIYLGNLFASQLPRILATIRKVDLVLVALVAVLGLLWWWRRRRARRERDRARNRRGSIRETDLRERSERTARDRETG